MIEYQDEPAREGRWMITATGRRFYPCDPRPEDVCLDDVAHSLARICRFGGHVRCDWYSVAQHSVLVSMVVRDLGGSPRDVFAGLMHDAAEAYLGDVVWPLKHSAPMDGYRRAEVAVESAVAAHFGIRPTEWMSAIVKRADKILLATEKRDLIARRLPIDAGWSCDGEEPMNSTITGLPPTSAELLFRASYAKARAGFA